MPPSDQETEYDFSEIDLSLNEFDVPEPDRDSKKEEKALSEDGKRHEREKKTVHSVFVCFMWLLAFGAALMVLVRIYHLIVPEDWRWLCETDIQTIDKILTSAIAGALLGKYSDSILNRK